MTTSQLLVLVVFIVIGITVSRVSGWTHGIHIILLHFLSYPLSELMTWKVHLSITIYQILFSQDMSLHWLHHSEKSDYWLACCVRGKQKLAQPITDDDGFTYPTGSVVVARTWLQTYMLKRSEISTFKDYQKHRKTLIYLHLIIETNVKLLKHQGRPKVK